MMTPRMLRPAGAFVVGLVNVVEFVLGGHRLIEQKLAVAVEAEQSMYVGTRVGLAVKTSPAAAFEIA